MSASPTLPKEMLLTCEACGTRVSALRRGRCQICYLRWTEARPVGLGAACVVCGERRHENLRSVEFQRKWLPMCHNCATRTFRMQPIPHTIEAIREVLSRDRRWQERRIGRRDNRLFPSDRRADERRAEGMQTEQAASDYLDASDLVVEIMDKHGHDEAMREEATRIALENEKGGTQRSMAPQELTGPQRPTSTPPKVVIADDLDVEEILILD
ncbi:MAG: hypothetical protein JRH20_00225 [Deltaproteobacteria bacterium]|nr:hypothetical protein [Deltaproteobacteria bacterium]